MAGRKANPVLFGYVFTGFACLFLAVGIWLAWGQARLMRTAVAVPAVIDGAHVDSHLGSKGATIYKPVVDFTYRVDGTVHTGHDPLPMVVSTSSSAPAELVVAQFKAGQEVSAWVDPANPDKAFLLRETSFFPYVFIIFPMIHATLGICFALLAKQEPPVIADRLWKIILVWYGIGLLVIGHYSAAGGEWTVLPVLAMAIYAALGSVLIFVRRKYAAAPAADELAQR